MKGHMFCYKIHCNPTSGGIQDERAPRFIMHNKALMKLFPILSIRDFSLFDPQIRTCMPKY